MSEITFRHTKSSNITLITAENCPSRRSEKITKELHTVMNMYKERGFRINVYNKDNEFNTNALRDHISL